MEEPSATPEPAPDPRIGGVLDSRYRITRKLGEGGMGLVYEATHVFLKTRVALKVLRADASDRESIERLKREAQAASAIGHPHIVDVRDFGQLPDGSTYVVMEFIDGVDLLTEIRREPMSWERARHIALQIAEALAAAHARGIVHRDLKPENILLTIRDAEADYVKLVDFGIARVQGATKLTAAGRVIGTPEYMAPEQCAGIDVDHRADIYALGVLLYEMVTATLPFYDADIVQLLRMQIKEPPIPPSKVKPEANLPLELEGIILRCLAKRPSQRFQSMEDVAEALRTLRPAEAPAPDPHEPDPFAKIGTQATELALTAVPARPTPSAQPAAPRRGGAIAVGLFAIAALAGGAAVVVALGGADAPPPREAAPRAPSAATPPPPAPELAAPAAVVEPATAPARSAQIRLETQPSGARVFRGDALIGETPLTLVRPSEGERIVMTVRHRGFADEEIAIGALSAEELRVTLAPRRGGGPAATAGEPAAPHPEPVAGEPAGRPELPATHRPGFMNPWE